jgi:hypothetical protein
MAKKKAAAPKAPKTTPTAPRAPKASWTTKQRERVNKLRAGVQRLAGFYKKAQPPGVGAASTALHEIDVRLDALSQNLAALGDWKPKARAAGKPGQGDKVQIKLEHASAPLFAVIPPAVFSGAEIVGEDGKTNWIVRCSDNHTRTISKRYVERYVAPESPAATLANVLAQ